MASALHAVQMRKKVERGINMNEFLMCIGFIIVSIIIVTSTIWGMASVYVAIVELKDKQQKFTVIYAAIGWFILGLLVASIL